MLFMRDISKESYKRQKYTRIQNQEECVAQILILDAVAHKTKSKKHYVDKEHQNVMKLYTPNYTAFK